MSHQISPFTSVDNHKTPNGLGHYAVKISICDGRMTADVDGRLIGCTTTEESAAEGTAD